MVQQKHLGRAEAEPERRANNESTDTMFTVLSGAGDGGHRPH
jgi:hypothetical protein